MKKIRLLFGIAFISIFASCGLFGADGDDELVTAQNNYFLKVESAVPVYNVGDVFDKQTDFKVFKYRSDGKITRIPNENCTVTMDKDKPGAVVIDPTVRFSFQGSVWVTVEHDGLSDKYKAVVTQSGYNPDGGGGNSGYDPNGGPIQWIWGE